MEYIQNTITGINDGIILLIGMGMVYCKIKRNNNKRL